MQKAGLVLWLLVCAILVLDIGDACVHAQDSSSSQKAKEVDIVNASGVIVIELMDTLDGPQVELCDASGEARMMPGAYKDNTGIDFFDANLNSIVALGRAEVKGAPLDALRINPKGQASVNLYRRGADTNVTIGDKAGKERLMATYSSEGDFAEIGTESAKDQTGTFVSSYGKLAHVVIDDPHGTPRADFGVDTDNNAYFALADSGGNTNWDKTFDANGSPASLGGGAGGSNGYNGGAGDSLRRNGPS